jgi:uncharacterized membrane protein YedE/YeeE
MKTGLAAFAAGLLFGSGLMVSGMVDPRNVVAFLDFAGRWNPNLAAVMVGAIGVHALLLRRPGARSGWRPLAPSRGGPGIDAPLLIGSATFGVGWGLAGYCPGPAIVAVGFGAGRVLVFVVAMIAGTLLADALAGSRRPSGPVAAGLAGPGGRSLRPPGATGSLVRRRGLATAERTPRACPSAEAQLV